MNPWRFPGSAPHTGHAQPSLSKVWEQAKQRRIRASPTRGQVAAKGTLPGRLRQFGLIVRVLAVICRLSGMGRARQPDRAKIDAPLLYCLNL
jgi:hypothetical protein